MRDSSAKSSEEEEHEACVAFLFISNFLKDFMLYTFYMRYFQLLRMNADAFGTRRKYVRSVEKKGFGCVPQCT